MIESRPLEQRLGRREPHLLDVLVDRGVLLDVGVGRRHVGLGLVVVVVGDEVLDRVVREELPELAVELRGQRLVVRQHQRRPLHALDHVGDGEGLAGAGDAEQRLVREAVAEPVDQLGDRRRLVARRLVVGAQAEPGRVHGGSGWRSCLGGGRGIGLKYRVPTRSLEYPLGHRPRGAPEARQALAHRRRSPAASPSSRPRARTSSASASASPTSTRRRTSPTRASRRSARASRATPRSRASRT